MTLALRSPAHRWQRHDDRANPLIIARSLSHNACVSDPAADDDVGIGCVEAIEAVQYQIVVVRDTSSEHFHEECGFRTTSNAVIRDDVAASEAPDVNSGTEI